MKVLYIKKKSKTKNWSDVLDRQIKQLKKKKSATYFLFEVDTSNFTDYVASAFKIFSLIKDEKIQVVYVNHVICAYPAILSLLFFRHLSSILSLHESEPVLGKSFVRRFSKQLPFKVKLRYSFLFKIPPRFFKKIIILNNQQNLKKRANYFQLNYLGIPAEKFTPKEPSRRMSEEEFRIFFPHNPERPEKGEVFARQAVEKLTINIDYVTGGHFSYQEMKGQYSKADVILITSMYETYSLLLLEAMAMNKFIIVTHLVGLAENLMKIYSKTHLQEYGVLVVAQDTDEICNALTILHKQILKGTKPKSRQLLLQEKLTEQEANERLHNFILSSNSF